MDTYGKYVITESQKQKSTDILTPLATLKPGDDSFAFSYPDKSGKTVTMADLRGKVVLVDVWATWCAPCRIEMPSLQALNKEFGPKGLKIIGINTHDEATDSTVRAFANGYGLTFDILRDVPAAGHDSMTAIYKVTGYPESFVIDKSGMIRKKWAAYDDWSSQGNRSLVAQLLGLPVPSPVTPLLGDTALRPRLP